MRLFGGLGNQMFQYAAGLALAQRHKTDLLFDLEWFEAFRLHQGLELPRVFGLELPAATTDDKRRVLGWVANSRLRQVISRKSLRWLCPSSLAIEPYFHFWLGFQHLPSNVYLSGYWQSYRYFSTSSNLIRHVFRFVSPLDTHSANLAREMEETTSVSLHIRRGDYVRNPRVSQVHGVDLMQYYKKAIELISRQVPNPHYFVFSDEPEWVRDNLEIAAPWTLVVHNRGADSYRDMQLMSLCRHHIIANSSFSWWGAWLNPKPDKIVVAPMQWFVNNRPTDDLIPESWIRL